MTKRLLIILALPPALLVFWLSLFVVKQERIDAVLAEIRKLIV
jgi:hypothetical protein